MYSGATNEVLSDEFLAGLKRAPEAWKPYRFSRRWGVEKRSWTSRLSRNENEDESGGDKTGQNGTECHINQ